MIGSGRYSLTDVPFDIIDQIMQRYNEIVAALNHEPSQLEPVFWQAKEGHMIAMDWWGLYGCNSLAYGQLARTHALRHGARMDVPSPRSSV